MNEHRRDAAPGAGVSDARWGQEIAADLKLLALLHDRELSPDLASHLRALAVRHWFALTVEHSAFTDGARLLDDAIAAFVEPLDDATRDELASDYAAIYLLHTYRAPPTESPWLDKDKLERQGPMFELAAWYAHHGLGAANRQLRPDDHIVLQLQFIAHLVERCGSDGEAEAAHFLDAHLGRWLGAFAERVATRCRTPFYAGLALVSHGYVEALREALARRTGVQRAVPQAAASSGGEDIAETESETEQPFLPGGHAPGW